LVRIYWAAKGMHEAGVGRFRRGFEDLGREVDLGRTV